METKTYHTMREQKLAWGDGPWVDEPDKVQWQDPATGLPCLIVRNHSGALCGYVGLSEGHPLYGKPYDEADEYASPHGGFTFADFCQQGVPEEQGICHVPAPGEPDRVFWLGFDCCHGCDVAPSMVKIMAESRSRACSDYAALAARMPAHMRETYKTIAYVTRHCTEAAQALAEMVAR